MTKYTTVSIPLILHKRLEKLIAKKTGFKSLKSVFRSDNRMSQPQPSNVADVGAVGECESVKPYMLIGIMG